MNAKNAKMHGVERIRQHVMQRGRASQRRGAAAVLGLALLISLIVLLAVTLDYGHITVAQAELRRSADAAAMAGCWEMFDQAAANGGDVTGYEYLIANAADITAQSNSIGGSSPTLASNDIEIGFLDIANPDVVDTNAANKNAVRVTLRRQNTANGELPLFFGALTGRDTQSLHVSATAAMLTAISGFQTPPDSSTTVNLFPFALDLPTWNDMEAGNGSDDYNFNGSSVVNGGDGIVECNLYPKGNGSPGNRGTVDIGGANNSTNDLKRQIVHGISQQDFIDLGYPLEFDGNGELELNGDTGISAGIKAQLASIIGQTRIIPIFTTVSGNGNNAMYTIVKWEGVRIMGVKLTGNKNKKHLTIQPAKVLARGSTIDTTGTSSSSFLYTPVMLVN